MFEPFFTTKPLGHGTGLGLAMAYGFVKQSNGHIRIYSEIGEGTTIKVYLPRFAGCHRDDTAASPLSEPAGERHLLPVARTGETILVVEDDDGVQAYVQEALEALGYRVLTATHTAAAIALLDARGGAGVDLLFTDIVMPGGADGLALARTAAERWPTLPVLFTTGYSPHAVIDCGRVDARFRVISKPYSFDALAREIRECLDSAHGPAD